MDRRGLARSPDEGYDRERAVRLGVQQVTAVLSRISITLFRRQDLRGGHMQPELTGDQACRTCPAGPAPRRGSHGADQVAKTSLGSHGAGNLSTIHIYIVWNTGQRG